MCRQYVTKFYNNQFDRNRSVLHRQKDEETWRSWEWPFWIILRRPWKWTDLNQNQIISM